jgi:PAS domain S-box-containing protein
VRRLTASRGPAAGPTAGPAPTTLLGRQVGRLALAPRATLFALSYLALTQVGLALQVGVDGVGAFWPAAGLSAFVFLTARTREWPAFALALLVADTLGNLLHLHRAAASLGVAAADLLEPLVGVLVWRVLSGQCRRPALSSMKETLLLVVAVAVAGPCAGATLGGVVAGWLGNDSFLEAWRVWFASSALGELCVAPLLLSLTAGARRRRRRATVETSLVVAATAALTLVVVAGGSHTLTFVAALPLMWAALRCGVSGTCLASLALVLAATGATAAGLGAYAGLHPVGDLQVLLAWSVLVALVTASAVSALKQSRARLQALLDNSTTLISVKGRDLRYELVNRGFAEALGRRPEELIGRAVADVFPESAETATAADLRVLETGEPDTSEARLSFGPALRTFVSVKFPLRDAEGAITGIGTISTDITDRQAAEAERDGLLDTLRRRDAALHAINRAATLLLRTGAVEDGIRALLAGLGDAADVSRAYVFENHPGPGGVLCATQRYEWTAPGVPPDTLPGSTQAVPYASRTMAAWARTLSAGRPLEQHMRDLPAADREAEFPADLRSIAVAPIMVDGRWWGYLGVDECRHEREWGAVELEVLTLAAGLVGAALERRSAEQALRESESRFRALADSLPQLVWTADETGAADWFSRPWLAFTGLPARELLGRGWLEAVHPDDRARCAAAYELAFERREPYELEYRLRRADGAFRRVLDRGLPRHRENGSFAGYVGACLDVTERAEAEDALRRRDAILAALSVTAERVLRDESLELEMDAILAQLGAAADVSRMYVFRNEVDPDGEHTARQLCEWCAPHASRQRDNPALQRVPWTSEPARRWRGALAAGRPIQQRTADLPPGARELLVSQEIRALALAPIAVGGVFWGYLGFDECRHDRLWLPAELDALTSAARMIGAAFEHREAGNALRRSESRFRSLSQLAPIGIFETDATGANTWVNERWCDLTGLHERDGTGHGWVESIHPDDRERVTAAWSRAAAEGSEYRVEYRLVPGRAGETRWVEATAIGLRGEDGRVRGYLGTVTDVTERKRAEERGREELAAEREQVERLRELDRLKDEFVATVSHELRTPLTSILGYVKLLRELETSEDGAGFLDVVERNGRRLLALVDDLLLVARIGSSRVELEREACDLAAVLHHCVASARPRAEAKGVALALEAEPLPLHGDTQRLAQVFDNLISNALKFTPEGGSVTVRGRVEGGVVVAEVEDTGIGIPPAEQDRVFTRFFRSSSAVERAVQGTGLGLTIAKAIVEAHGGTIGFRSAEGEGTTFRVELPRRAAEHPAAVAA